MSSYLDYLMRGNGNNFYEQKLNEYRQQLGQLNPNMYGGQPLMNPMMQQSFQPMMPPQMPIMQQPVMQQPIQQQPVMQQLTQQQNDLYLQSLFLEFLRSPEMKDFTTHFYQRFAQFYKNKTGLEYNDQHSPIPYSPTQQNVPTQIPQQQMVAPQQTQQVQQPLPMQQIQQSVQQSIPQVNQMSVGQPPPYVVE